MKKRIVPGTIPTKDLHQYLLGSVSPRPIAFVSTKDKAGRDNIAPYSFFNVFSSNPPIAVFSSNRRVDDNTTKDTLRNIQINKECVINVVNYSIMRQMALCSVSFPADVSEFEVAGLTPEPSEMVNAASLKESPVNMECKVKDIITLGEHGGAGHLIICDIVLIKIDENVIDGERINPHKIDLVGRMGRSYYVRASGDAVLTLYQSVKENPIGFTKLPDYLKQSEVLTANDLAELASCTSLPAEEALDKARQQYHNMPRADKVIQAKNLIKNGKKQDALTLLLSLES